MTIEKLTVIGIILMVIGILEVSLNLIAYQNVVNMAGGNLNYYAFFVSFILPNNFYWLIIGILFVMFNKLKKTHSGLLKFEKVLFVISIILIGMFIISTIYILMTSQTTPMYYSTPQFIVNVPRIISQNLFG